MFAFDEKSHIWLQPFSALINCMFPVEYVYADWIGFQAGSRARRADPECPACPNERIKDTGSQVEGFCIPDFAVRKNDVDCVYGSLVDVTDHWKPDFDEMKVADSFFENDGKKQIQIFTPEHVEEDPRYAKLRLTKEWKDCHPLFRNVDFLHHAFLLPDADHQMDGLKQESWIGGNADFSYTLHGPVRKLKGGDFHIFEVDTTTVFTYPDAWPEAAMEWLVRPRPSGWPSSELVQEIFESGCHLAPVGRGKRFKEPVDAFHYKRSPVEATLASSPVLRKLFTSTKDNCGKWVMDETEWRISFSFAENKLGASVLPVQRHVMVLLKMIKKFYFPSVISTYFLKNLLFWECEKKDEIFWREDNSASCLLFMLDRLQEYLESRCLPHYIIPQSNLLLNEDPSSLKEAAAVVADVRCNIFSKTYNLLRRLQSMNYQSQTYFINLGLQLEDQMTTMQERNLAVEGHRKLLVDIHSVFVDKCKVVIDCLLAMDRHGIEEMVNVALCVYQSLLARTLCKLWFLINDDGTNNALIEKNFNSFVKEEIGGLFSYGYIVSVAHVFFHNTRKGIESSKAIPMTGAMWQLRDEQMKIAQENIEEANAQLKPVINYLKQTGTNMNDYVTEDDIRMLGLDPEELRASIRELQMQGGMKNVGRPKKH